MNNLEYIKGEYKRNIFQSSTGYVVGLFKVKETSENIPKAYINTTITFTGYFHELNDIDTYIFYGKFIEHEKYGKQFQVESYDRCKPEEKDSIVEFLTSGLFKGIGEAKATKIVNILGKNTLNTILENPNNLLLIPSITEKNVRELHTKLKEYERSYDTIIKLTNLGFTSKESMIIYNYYHEKTLEVISNNIYQIEKDIDLIKFKRIDQIALKNNTPLDDAKRIESAIIYIMNELSNSYGHSYYYLNELIPYLEKVLMTKISNEKVLECLNNLKKNQEVIELDEAYYTKEMYDAETYIVNRINILMQKEDNKVKNIDNDIEELESYFDLKYNKDQLEAIKNSYLKNFLIITGGPGTGKTTIMRAICELYRMIKKYNYEKLQDRIALLAPTGRAAKRMSEQTHLQASTIHRFLRWNKEANKFQINEYNKSKVEFVLIDEASMIDTYLFSSLLKGLSINTKIIMVGDVDQLPSVGPGQVLEDLIASSKVNVIRLNELYRQQENSNIITLAYDIKKGCLDEKIFNKAEDLTFISCSNDNVLANIEEISTTYLDYSYKNFQVLAPMYKTINGIDAINEHLQKIFNPKSSERKEILISNILYREQDKVIQLTNMPDDNVFNGDVGIIERINNTSKKEIYIDFDGNVVKYSQSNFLNFKKAYATSIHKSQGSEFDIVIIPIVKNFQKMLYRKLIYTAVTRCKKKLYLIGDIGALKIAIANNNNDLRRTTIKKFLIEGIK